MTATSKHVSLVGALLWVSLAHCALVSQVPKCPPVEDIKALGCSCRGAGNVECRDVSSLEALEAIARVLEPHRINELLLTGAFVPYLPDGLFARISTNILSIRQSAINHLAKDSTSNPFKDSPITMLMISDTKIIDNDYSALSDLKLESVWFQKQTNLDMSSLKTFLHADILKEIRIVDCSVNKFQGALAEFSRLQVIVLQGIELNVIHRTDLPTDATELRQVQLSGLGISTLEDNIFEGMHNLEYINLDKNPIETLSLAVLSNFRGMLLMRFTRLVCDGRMSWLKQSIVQGHIKGIVTCHDPAGVDITDVENI